MGTQNLSQREDRVVGYTILLDLTPRKSYSLPIISRLIANSPICEMRVSALDSWKLKSQISIIFLCFLESRMALNTSSQTTMGFPGGPVVEDLPASAGDMS